MHVQTINWDHEYTEAERQRHRSIFKADYALYDHFLQRFQTIVNAQGPDFPHVVEAYRRALEHVQAFCFKGTVASQETSIQVREDLQFTSTIGQNMISFNGGIFTKQIDVIKTDCKRMQTSETIFVPMVRNAQLERYKKISRTNNSLTNSRHRRKRTSGKTNR